MSSGDTYLVLIDYLIKFNVPGLLPSTIHGICITFEYLGRMVGWNNFILIINIFNEHKHEGALLSILIFDPDDFVTALTGMYIFVAAVHDIGEKTERETTDA